jgi:hypothetical protein
LTLAYGYVCALCHDAAVREQRLLKDAEVTAKFEKTIKGTFCPEFAAAQHRVTLKRLFSLVLFLDRAKVRNSSRPHGRCGQWAVWGGGCA